MKKKGDPMKQLLLITLIATGCALEAPIESTDVDCNDAWNDGYDACIADTTTLSAQIDELTADLASCEYLRQDEIDVFTSEMDRLNDLNLALKHKITELESELEL